MNGEMMMMVVVMVVVMVEFWSCAFVRAAIEEIDDYVLSSANISETHAVDSMPPTIVCSVAPPRRIVLGQPLCNTTDVSFQSLVRLLGQTFHLSKTLHSQLHRP